MLACAALAAGLLAWAAAERALAPAGNTAQDHFDALIVLGSPTDSDGNPRPVALARVTEAVHQYERGAASHIVFTGGAVRNRFVEASAMARTAEAQGIPPSAVFLDLSSRSTLENACNAFGILRRHGWQSAEVISSSSQLPRTALILSRLPLRWRVHAAPPLEPVGAATSAYRTAEEILKTAYYLTWTRQMEPCNTADR